MSYGDKTIELVERRSPNAIVIQPQIEEMNNVENEPDISQLQNGNSSPEFIPTPDLHAEEPQCLTAENEDSDDFEIVIQPQDDENDDLEDERYNTLLQNRYSNLEINPTLSLPKDDSQFLVSQDKECDNMETRIQPHKEVAAKEKHQKQMGNYALELDPSPNLHPHKSQFIGPQNEDDETFEIVIQPQSDEEENLENEPSSTQVHSRDGSLDLNSSLDLCADESQFPTSQGDENLEIKPLHVLDTGNNQNEDPILEIYCSPEPHTHESPNTLLPNKESENMEINPTLGLNADKNRKIQVSDTETNEMCSFRLTEYWSHGSNNKITAVYSPVNPANNQIPNIVVEETTMKKESDYDTDSASENGDSPIDTNRHREEKEISEAHATDAATEEVCETSGHNFIKDELMDHAYRCQREPLPVKDKAKPKLPNKELIVKLKDVSKESEITFYEQKKDVVSGGDELGGCRRAKTSRIKKIARKCPDCNEWIIGELKTHKLRTYCMIVKRGKSLKCLKCECLFAQTKRYVDHFKACDIKYQQEQDKQKIETLVDEKGKRTIQCMICNTIIVGKHCFMDHFVNAHLQSLENDNGLKLVFEEKIGEIRCLICGKSEVCRPSLLQHFTLAHDLKFPFYNCNQCNVGTCNYDHLIKHWQETHPNLIGKCKLCSEWLPKSEIEKHIESEHFGTPMSPNSHMESLHRKTADSDNKQGQSKIEKIPYDKSKKAIQCINCDKFFISKQSFLVHFVNVHLHSLENDNGLKLRITSDEKVAEVHCMICGQFEVTKPSLLLHFSGTHNLKFPFYKCYPCNAATCNYQYLIKHWKEEHPNLVGKCQLCSKWLPKSQISKHLKAQHSQVFLASQKKKQRPRSNGAKQEKAKMNLPVVKQKCPKCNKFVRKDKLWLHLKTPASCIIQRDKCTIICMSCNQAFLNKQFLLIHYVHVHLQGLGDQNNGFNLQYTPKGNAIGIQCLICDKYEPTTQALLGHFGEVHNLTVQYYDCNQCTAATCSYDELTRHWQKAHPTEPNKCELCSKWVSKMDIKNHLQLKHFLFKCEKCNVYVSIYERIAHERMQCRFNKTLQENPLDSIPETKHVPQTLKKPDDIIKSVRIAKLINPTLCNLLNKRETVKSKQSDISEAQPSHVFNALKKE